MFLFWQPPSCFLQWSPSSFVADGVSYSCAEQFMVAEKGRFFQDYLADELIVLRRTRVRTSALVEACVTPTKKFGTAFAKTTSVLATLPSSHRTRP